jgi:hypothetical protein
VTCQDLGQNNRLAWGLVYIITSFLGDGGIALHVYISDKTLLLPHQGSDMSFHIDLGFAVTRAHIARIYQVEEWLPALK